jgi:hypothetical protein
MHWLPDTTESILQHNDIESRIDNLLSQRPITTRLPGAEHSDEPAHAVCTQGPANESMCMIDIAWLCG